MTELLRIALGQLNFTVGDITGNTKKIITAARHAKHQLNADLIVFPELTLTSYPPEDLLHNPAIYSAIEKNLQKICETIKDIDVVVAHPLKTENGIFNSCTWIRNGKKIAVYHKQKLPNYGVFDECRYFLPGHDPVIVEIKGIKAALLICEDLWFADPIYQAQQAGAQLIISPNASPYSYNKAELRKENLIKRVNEAKLPIIYVNHVGGQDDLLFDGGSLVINETAEVCCQLNNFIEQIEVVEVTDSLQIKKHTLPAKLNKVESVYQALVLGVRDYLHKNGFKQALLGLSGGIDSALTLAITVDAIGAENVEVIMMPSRYTSKLSLEEAKNQANLLQVNYQEISIEPLIEAYAISLQPFMELKAGEITAQNIQARIRGALLMALSNKSGKIVLSTSNKSEMAVGYSTIYGDMVGGLCVLKDVFKTLVYELAQYRNSISAAIPQAVLDRPPSAELAENQTDQDSLPPYSILDQILEMYIERNFTVAQIIQQGFARETVQRVVKLIKQNEYKRRQAPPGVRITDKALFRDWRYPLTNRFVEEVS